METTVLWRVLQHVKQVVLVVKQPVGVDVVVHVLVVVVAGTTAHQVAPRFAMWVALAVLAAVEADVLDAQDVADVAINALGATDAPNVQKTALGIAVGGVL